jgi:hypothetical protein
MKTLTKALLATLISTSITACGGGSSSSEPVAVTPTPTPTTSVPAAKTITLTGNVIDGYVIGATVFLDLNFNGLLDDGEPSDVTVDEVPGYTLEAPENCGQYVPLVTHVPVGAIDLDFPDTQIEEEYYMTTAPLFLLKTDETMKHVTPLTTLVWSEIESVLSAEGVDLSCASIINNQELRKDIEVRLGEQERRVATRYNITVDSLYSDYIADANTELHGLAQSLVPGLVKSYADTVTLEAARPDASIKFVEYFFKDALSISTETWSRREFIQTSPGNFDDMVNAMTNGLATIGTVEAAYTARTSITNGIKLVLKTTFEENQCTETEKFSELTTDGVAYGLTNRAYMQDSTWASCQEIDTVEYNIGQEHSTDIYFNADGTGSRSTYSSHSFLGDNVAIRTELIGATTSDFVDGFLSSILAGYSLAFEDTADMGADFWFRATTEFPDSGDIAQFLYSHNSVDLYKVLTVKVDGTRTRQCGTWSGGASSLVDCT